jgi:uncharacterized RDD family membrane protein YckC
MMTEVVNMKDTLPPDVDRLIEQLKSPSSFERVTAIAGLTILDCHDERVIQALVHVARNDPDKMVRGEAQSTISRLGSPIRPPDGWVSAGTGEYDWRPDGYYIAKATFWQRFAAFILDMIILAFASGILSSLLGRFTTPSWLGMPLEILLILIYPLYFIWAYATTGQTIGKNILHIKVVSKDGLPLNWTQGIIRTLGYIISGFPFYLGYFWSIWDAEKQAWHDKIAGTYVVLAYVDRERLLGLSNPALEHPRQKGWLLVLGILILLLVIAGAGLFDYFIEQGVSEVRAMGPWPGSDVSPEELVTLDLAEFGLEPDKIMDARDEEWISDASFQDGVYKSYKAGETTVVAIWALRYIDRNTASSDYAYLTEWAKSSCGFSKYAYLAGSGIIHCGFSDYYSKIFWNDQWIVVIDASTGTEYTPAVLVDKVRDEMAAYWH